VENLPYVIVSLILFSTIVGFMFKYTIFSMKIEDIIDETPPLKTLSEEIAEKKIDALEKENAKLKKLYMDSLLKLK